LEDSWVLAAISCETKQIGAGLVSGADACDEVVNNFLMGIATGQSWCLGDSGQTATNGQL
jgi:hypothetical protein